MKKAVLTTQTSQIDVLGYRICYSYLTRIMYPLWQIFNLMGEKKIRERIEIFKSLYYITTDVSEYKNPGNLFQIYTMN